MCLEDEVETAADHARRLNDDEPLAVA
jgi:hypothetical protein